MRFFFGENANRPLKIAGAVYAFEIVGHTAGTAQGVLAVEDDKAESFAVDAARLGVVEITEEDYTRMRSKKKRLVNQPAGAPQPLPPTALSAIKGAGGVVLEGKAVTLAQRSEELPVSAADAVTVQRISADAPSGSADPKPVRSGWAKPGARSRARRGSEEPSEAPTAGGDSETAQAAGTDETPAI